MKNLKAFIGLVGMIIAFMFTVLGGIEIAEWFLKDVMIENILVTLITYLLVELICLLIYFIIIIFLLKRK